MKLTAFVLLTYISFLTIQPLAKELYSILHIQTEEACEKEKDSCCKSEDDDNKKQKKKQASDNRCSNRICCNPFACCICAITNQATYINIVLVFLNELSTSISSNFTSAYFADYFRPPELAN